ncbi:MAG: hypothetical protein QXJ72_05575 [Thermoproteota archaeon]
MSQINVEEVKRTVIARIAPYVKAYPALAAAVNVEEIADIAVKAFYELEERLKKSVENAEKRLVQAQLDLEKAKKELELRTQNPEQFIYKTAEEITLRRMDALRYQILKQKKAFENGASTILKRSIKNY